MILRRVSFLAVLCLCALVRVSRADIATLNDWCFNVNGDTSVCNGAAGSGPGIDVSGFDLTLGPNGLGTATVTLGAGLGQFAGIYLNYDVDYNAGNLGSFGDYGTVTGLLPPGVSYSVNDPSAADGSSPFGLQLFDEFYNNALDDTNYVAISQLNILPNALNPPCCEVSWALTAGGINVPVGESAVVTFTTATTAPASGFYLQNTNATTGDSIYLTESVNVTGSEAPEPAGFSVGIAVILGCCFAACRRRAAAQA